MGSTGIAAMLFYCVALSVVAVGFAVPEKSPKFISMDALECSNNITSTTTSRKLAQVECPVQFEHARGVDTVVRSCRGRGVPSAQRCCGALKTFACPYRDLLNDNAQNGCASAMFFEIIVRGRLRPGLFSQMCAEDPQEGLGLTC